MDARGFTLALSTVLCLAFPLLARAQPNPTASPVASSAPAAPAPPMPSPTPSPGPPPTGEITSSAKDWLHRLQTGNVDRSQFDAQMNASFTDDQLKQVVSQFSALGEPATFAFVDSRILQGITAYRYTVTFKSGAPTSTWLYAVDSDGKIAGAIPPSDAVAQSSGRSATQA